MIIPVGFQRVNIDNKARKKLGKKLEQKRKSKQSLFASDSASSVVEEPVSETPSDLFTPSGSISPEHKERVEQLQSEVSSGLATLSERLARTESRLRVLKSPRTLSPSDSGSNPNISESVSSFTSARTGKMASFYEIVRDSASQFTPGDLIPGVQLQAATMTRLTSLIDYDYSNMLGNNPQLVKEAQEMFEYKGMDIWIILQKYLMKAKDDRDAERSLVHMIVALCERGTNYAKFKNKMGSAGKQAIETIAAKYGLVSKLSPDIANELTLARVGHAFPMLVCSYMNNCKSPTVPQSKMEKWAKGYPACMKASAFTALIPAEAGSGFTISHWDRL